MSINEKLLPGFNVLLMGPAGTGKTHSIGTLVDTGMHVYYMALESGLESLLGYWTDRGLEVPANLHYHTVAAPSADFSTLMESAKKVNTLALDTLAKTVDPKKSKHDRFVSVLKALNNFTDDRTGEEFGPVNEWGNDKALVIDGMTGLGKAAMSLVIGGKPVRSQSDWGIAQGQLESLVSMICDNCSCNFVLISHVDRETDAVLGGVKLMISTLGKALSPTLPAMFSDVILTVKKGTTWTWDTASAQADVKTRNLPISSNIVPNFKQIVDKWDSRHKKK